MTDIQHIDVDDEQYEDAPRDLRNHVKQIQKALNELRAERDGLRNQISESALGDVLAGFKNPERVKRDLLADKVDPLDSEAVSKWMESNAGDYARGEATPAPAAGEQAGEQQVEVPDYRRLNGVAEIGTPSGADKADVVRNAPKDASPAELAAYFTRNGI